METKIFGDKKITIRRATKLDLRNAKKFQVFMNSLIGEETKIHMNKRVTTKEEREWLEKILRSTRNKSRVQLFAECDNKIIGVANIELDTYRKNHIGNFGILVKDGYRGEGLGKYLMSEIIKLAKKELNPKPKIIQLEVYATNKPAINLYKKFGLKIVAKIPKQIQYKGKLVTEFIMLREV